MDQITSASLADFHRVRTLLRDGQSVFTDFGSEDLTALLGDGIAVLGSTTGGDWGVLLIQRRNEDEAPPPAQRFAMLRGLALGKGRSAIQDVPRLVQAADDLLGERSALQVILYATDAWTVAPLIQAGFAIEDRLLFLALTNLQQRKLSPPSASPAVRLRPAQPGDVAGLVQLDEGAFEPIWRLNATELMTLLLSGRLQVAEQDEMLLGYTALSMQGEETAHLARLAVHPVAQGLGIGRTLLHDAVVYARQRLVSQVLLNTQGKNVRAQDLYRAYGFRSAGKVVPVLTRTLGHGN